MALLSSRMMTMLTGKLAAAFGITVVITPLDGLGTITVTDAVLGNEEIDVSLPGQSGARRERDTQDFLIPVASLTRSGSTVLPVKGDRYAATIGGTAYVFQAMPTTGTDAWKYTDTGKTQVRVYTKKVS